MSPTLFLLLSLTASASADALDTVVVCPPAFTESLRPWLTYRTQQGHKIGILSNEFSLEETRAAIRQCGKSGKLRHVLLVGDAEPTNGKASPQRSRNVPTSFITAKVNVQYGSETEIATDNSFADLDDDQLPDLAVGRLTADSPGELERMVQKILDYERSTDNGLWRQRLNFVAGVGGFGPLVDTVVESTTKKFLTDCIPSSYATSMTYGSWRSPFCPDPRRFHETTLRRLNEGCLFWVYLGHGQSTSVDNVQVPGGAFHILGTQDARQLTAKQHPPIAVFLACYTGAFDKPQDCLAEEMLRAEGGPVAVLCGSRVTMPYGMAVLGTSLLDECFLKQQPTLGEALLHAKRRSMTQDSDNLNRQMLDALASTLSPSSDSLVDERREHLALFNLLGDPLLRIRHPQTIQIQTPHDVDAGTTIEVVANCPIAGRCQVELSCRRDCLKESISSRDKFQPTHEALAAYSEVYELANNPRWCTEFVQIQEPGEFRTTLRVPPQAAGPCQIRLFTEGREVHAMGATNVFIRRASTARK